MSWRDHLPIHPAADLFPRMSEDGLRELGEHIKANGLVSFRSACAWFTLALRRDEPVNYAKCGKRIKRRMSGQKYCSRICCERSRERCRKGDDARAAAAQRRASDIWPYVIDTECFTGREWKSVVSPDGIQTWVTRFRTEPRNG